MQTTEQLYQLMRRLETRVKTKAGLSGQSLQVVSDVFINIVGRAEIVGV